MKKLLLFIIFAVSFGMNAQTIQSVSPNTGNLGQTLQVTITGDNTQFESISDTYNISFFNNLFEYLVVNSFTAVSNTEVTANVTIPASYSPGSYNLRVYTWQGVNSLDNAFTVVNTYNSISGHVGVDLNANGCDASDPDVAGIRVKINDGNSDSYAFTDNSGDYSIYVPAGNYVVTPETAYFTSAPVSATVNFATQNSLSETRDFCLSPAGAHNDLEVSILVLAPARPGFNASYRLVYKNNGTQVINGTVNLAFDDTRLDFVSAIPATASQTLNNLAWNYTNLLPFESRSIDFVLNVNSPQETPAVNNGDVLPFVATANPVSGDETPANNTANYDQIVIGSFDPNDKAVTEGSEIDLSDVGDYLHYIIRFQNSGTFAAENVMVRDMLAANLDKSTLEITSASHPYRTTLTAGNNLQFFFDNINLPPEGQDEPGSHGFIAFKIKPASTVGVGSVIQNTAQIYFDFNFPIVTNTVSTAVTLLSTKGFDAADDIVLYPNPAGAVLNIEAQSSFDTASVKIFNQLGQLVKTANNIGQSQTNTIAVGDLKTGTYFVQITTNKGTSTKKLIKN